MKARRQSKTPRNAELSKIHILKKELSMDDETYRNAMWSACRVRSAAELDHAGRQRFIEHLNGLKKNNKSRTYPGTPHNISGSPQLKKISALLTVNKLPWSYADGIAFQMFEKKRIAFCDPEELSAIITALIREYGDDYRGIPGRKA